MTSPNNPLHQMGVLVPDTNSSRKILQEEVYRLLGGGMIDLELDPEHYQQAVNMSLDRYRTRSQNSVEESFLFLEVQAGQDAYRLPNEVQEVRKTFRRGVGTSTGGVGASVDPFSLMMTNNLYGVTNQSNSSGVLSQYEMSAQYRSLLGRMFGEDLLFSWYSQSKKITFHRRFIGTEVIGLWCYNYRKDEVLLTDVYSKQWIRDYAVAVAKKMLGEARALYAQLPGPQGGVTLNGAEMKNEAIAEMERLDQELYRNKDASEGYGFIFG